MILSLVTILCVENFFINARLLLMRNRVKICEGKNCRYVLRQLLSLTANIFGPDRDIGKRLTALSTAISVPLKKKYSVNFGSLTPEITLMFTCPKLSVRVLRMLMHLTSGYVTLLSGISPCEFFLIGLMVRGRTHVGFCPEFVLVRSETTAFGADSSFPADVLLVRPFLFFKCFFSARKR